MPQKDQCKSTGAITACKMMMKLTLKRSKGKRRERQEGRNKLKCSEFLLRAFLFGLRNTSNGDGEITSKRSTSSVSPITSTSTSNGSKRCLSLTQFTTSLVADSLLLEVGDKSLFEVGQCEVGHLHVQTSNDKDVKRYQFLCLHCSKKLNRFQTYALHLFGKLASFFGFNLIFLNLHFQIKIQETAG